MNATRKDSTTDTIKQKSVNKPVSVYSLNFSEILSDAEREYLMDRVKPKKSALARPTVTNTRRNVQRGGAFLVIAIAAIGVMHFSFQLSFITREKAALTHKSVPALQIETAPVPVVAEASVTDTSTENQTDEQESAIPFVPRVAPAVKLRSSVPSPAPKVVPKRREVTESRTERLRRAERILTGI